MAISTGVAPHRAWLSVNGFLIPVISGDATQNGTRRSSTFSATVPLNYPGAEGALASITDNMSGVIVENVAGSGPLVMGEIDTVDFHYGQTGTIHVSGRDMSSKLHNKKINKKWTDQPTTQVVQDVCQLAGIGCQASGGGMTAGKELAQEHAKMADGETAASIIAKCAEQDNARWWCDVGGILHYEIDPPGGGYTVFYDPGPPERSDAFTISVKRNVQAAKQIQVTINSWHTKDKKMNTGKGQSGGSGGPLEYQYNIPGLKQGEPQQRAQNKANEIGRHAVEVTVKCVGDPTINVGSGLTLMGTAFAGAYVIDSIHHSFGMGGYTMTIKAKLGGGGGGGGGG
jgi:hypothetical protein